MTTTSRPAGAHIVGRFLDSSETAIATDLSRAAAVIPDDVPMGFHVCLGSMGNKHALIPEDARSQVSLLRSTALYLGLVDITDGLEGAGRRIEAAQSVLPSFGVSTVCGLGSEFYSRADAIAILDLYAALAEPAATG